MANFSDKRSSMFLAGVLLLFAPWGVAIGANSKIPGVYDVSGYEIKDSGYVSVGGGTGGGTVRWIDDNRVLFAGMSANARRANQENPTQQVTLPQLNLWDVTTNKVVAHHVDNPAWGKHWNGRLCVNGNHIWFSYRIQSDGTPQIERNMRLVGSFGKEKLSEFQIPPKSATSKSNKNKSVARRRAEYVDFNYLTCKEYRHSDVPNIDGRRVRPLLPGDYVMYEPINTKPNGEIYRSIPPWGSTFVSRNGTRTPLVLEGHVVGVGRYFRYLDSYVVNYAPSTISEDVPRYHGLLSRSGKIQDFTPPKGPWMRRHVTVAPTKSGMFMTSTAEFFVSNAKYRDRNGASGGYLKIDGQLKRLIAGIPWEFDISPNGCRVALTIADQNESYPFPERVKMLDVCSKAP